VHIRWISKGNLWILFLQPVRRQSVCRPEWFFLEKEFLKTEKCRQKVYLEEVQDEPLGQDFISDANVAERVEMSVEEKHHHNHEGLKGHVARLISSIS
jgi:hypothetical protein